MTRIRVALLLVGGMALSAVSATGEIIRYGRPEGSLIMNGRVEKMTVIRPGAMGTNRMKRFKKRFALSNYQVIRTSRSLSTATIKSKDKKSAVTPRQYPVVKLSASDVK